jgi:hypothetical protein
MDMLKSATSQVDWGSSRRGCGGRYLGLGRTWQWRNLLNDEPYDMYCSPNIIRVIRSRRMRWAGYVARMGGRRVSCRVSVGKSEGRRPRGRPRSRWEDNIKMDLQEMGWGGMDVIDLAQNRGRWQGLVNAVVNLRVPHKAENVLTS